MRHRVCQVIDLRAAMKRTLGFSASAGPVLLSTLNPQFVDDIGGQASHTKNNERMEAVVMGWASRHHRIMSALLSPAMRVASGLVQCETGRRNDYNIAPSSNY